LLTESDRRRIAVVCDLREEHWHSMNLVADMLLGRVAEGHADEFEGESESRPATGDNEDDPSAWGIP